MEPIEVFDIRKRYKAYDDRTPKEHRAEDKVDIKTLLEYIDQLHDEARA